jgi:hypothetical protein
VVPAIAVVIPTSVVVVVAWPTQRKVMAKAAGRIIETRAIVLRRVETESKGGGAKGLLG